MVVMSLMQRVFTARGKHMSFHLLAIMQFDFVAHIVSLQRNNKDTCLMLISQTADYDLIGSFFTYCAYFCK